MDSHKLYLLSEKFASSFVAVKERAGRVSGRRIGSGRAAARAVTVNGCGRRAPYLRKAFRRGGIAEPDVIESL
jgi:hypothetical protein